MATVGAAVQQRWQEEERMRPGSSSRIQRSFSKQPGTTRNTKTGAPLTGCWEVASATSCFSIVSPASEGLDSG